MAGLLLRGLPQREPGEQWLRGHQLLLLFPLLGKLVPPGQHILVEGDKIVVVVLDVCAHFQIIVTTALGEVDLVLIYLQVAHLAQPVRLSKTLMRIVPSKLEHHDSGCECVSDLVDRLLLDVILDLTVLILQDDHLLHTCHCLLHMLFNLLEIKLGTKS